MTLRVCFVGNLESIHTVRWVRYFAEHGVETHVLSVAGPSAVPLPAGVVVHEFRAPRAKVRAVAFALAGLTVLPRVWRARKIFHEIKPDIVHVHYLSDYALITAMTGFQPLVVTAWGSDVRIQPKRNPFLKWLVRYVTKRSTLITCDAEHMKAALVNLGVQAENVEVIFFGTDTDKFTPSKRDPKIYSQLGGDDRAQVVISLRRLEPIYDIPTLISAVPHVLKEQLLRLQTFETTEQFRVALQSAIGRRTRYNREWLIARNGYLIRRRRKQVRHRLAPQPAVAA